MYVGQAALELRVTPQLYFLRTGLAAQTSRKPAIAATFYNIEHKFEADLDV
jgi:hypothetical protein